MNEAITENMTTMTLSIRMFGTFRQYHHGALSLELPAGSTAIQVKEAIAATLHQNNPRFHHDDLIGKSVLADNQRILGDHEQINTPATLAILPPVCGG